MRNYLKAYYLKDLRQFADWNENRYQPPSGGSPEDQERSVLNDESIVYLGDDFVVLRDVFEDSPVIFDQTTDAWRAFCTKELGFEPPEEAKS